RPSSARSESRGLAAADPDSLLDGQRAAVDHLGGRPALAPALPPQQARPQLLLERSGVVVAGIPAGDCEAHRVEVGCTLAADPRQEVLRRTAGVAVLLDRGREPPPQ